MTKVSYIHGVGDSTIPKRKAEQRFIDFRHMTDGELRLSLIAEQLNILAEYYGRDEYHTAEQRVLAAVETGIHGHRSIGMVSGQLGQAIAREISRARSMTRPAAGVRLNRDLKSGIGNPLIPLEDCDQYLEWDEDRWGSGERIQVPTAESRACEERNDNVRMLNQHLEGSAHHLLYEYVANTNTIPATVAAKRVLHRNAVSKLSSITKLDRSNMRMWMRNGVLRNNITHGAPPMQPEDVIDTLKANGGASVGAAFLAALPALIGALASAVGATVALIQSIKAQKRQELLLAAQGIGSIEWGADISDFPPLPGQNGDSTPPQNGDDSGSGLLSGDITPLLLGGAALLMLK